MRRNGEPARPTVERAWIRAHLLLGEQWPALQLGRAANFAAVSAATRSPQHLAQAFRRPFSALPEIGAVQRAQHSHGLVVEQRITAQHIAETHSLHATDQSAHCAAMRYSLETRCA